MNEHQYSEIVHFLKKWVKDEGLCRFCDHGRICPKSRRGRDTCEAYIFAREMDCFHLWVAAFDGEIKLRTGYDFPDDYPWKGLPEECDKPPNKPGWMRNE